MRVNDAKWMFIKFMRNNDVVPLWCCYFKLPIFLNLSSLGNLPGNSKRASCSVWLLFQRLALCHQRFQYGMTSLDVKIAYSERRKNESRWYNRQLILQYKRQHECLSLPAQFQECLRTLPSCLTKTESVRFHFTRWTSLRLSSFPYRIKFPLIYISGYSLQFQSFLCERTYINKLKGARSMDAVYNASVNQVVEQLKTDLKSGLTSIQAEDL